MKYFVVIHILIRNNSNVYGINSNNMIIEQENLLKLNDIGARQLNLAEVRVPNTKFSKSIDISSAENIFLNLKHFTSLIL
jgi:hypothetical protein